MSRRPRFPTTIEHPLFPILRSCPVICLTCFGLSPGVAGVLAHALGGETATISDLLDCICSDGDGSLWDVDGLRTGDVTELRHALIAGWRGGSPASPPRP